MGSTAALRVFISETRDLAASELSQNPGSPILVSSSFFRACLAGRSKRVPDGDHPGRKVFDGLGEVVVDHGWGSLYSGMAWVYLLAAGICEIVWAIGLKKSEGFTRPWTSAWTIGVMLLSFWLLSFAMKSLPLGTAYAVWTGIGAVGTVAFGMAFLNEPKDLGRIACIAMIIGGIIGLRFLGKV